jgi:UPF0271 protein
MNIDLNADMGESFGPYALGADASLMPFITSANIACGFHAGDPSVMRRTVALAAQFGVAVGAHPGFHDLEGFGRRALQANPREIENDVLYQIGALAAFCRAEKASLTHAKPHGALYNLAERDLEIARAIARALARFDPRLIFVGRANSRMRDAAQELGLRFAREAFADRAYNPDGSLQSLQIEGSLITDPVRAAAQAREIVVAQRVTATSGEKIPIVADTLCIHGDNPRAVEIVQAVRAALLSSGVEIVAMNKTG